jgi:hypothetical protein
MSACLPSGKGLALVAVMFLHAGPPVVLLAWRCPPVVILANRFLCLHRRRTSHLGRTVGQLCAVVLTSASERCAGLQGPRMSCLALVSGACWSTELNATAPAPATRTTAPALALLFRNVVLASDTAAYGRAVTSTEVARSRRAASWRPPGVAGGAPVRGSGHVGRLEGRSQQRRRAGRNTVGALFYKGRGCGTERQRHKRRHAASRTRRLVLSLCFCEARMGSLGHSRDRALVRSSGEQDETGGLRGRSSGEEDG